MPKGVEFTSNQKDTFGQLNLILNSNKMIINKIFRGMIISISIVIGLFFTLFIFLLVKSTGKPDNFMDKAGNELQGSLSEKLFVTIGGVKQGMFIRSKNLNNPVLLYVHGGPAFPNYFLIDKYKPELEDNFTVCYWEQRGGGLSYSS